MLCVVLFVGCSGRPQRMTRHHVTVPCTNHYSVTTPTRIRTDVLSRRKPYRPELVVEYSYDGKQYLSFPEVHFAAGSNVGGVHQLDVSEPGDIWVRAITTNLNIVGEEVILTFSNGYR